MSALRRVRRSLDTTLCVHVVALVAAAVTAFALARVFAPVLGDGPVDAVRRGLLAEGVPALSKKPIAWAVPSAASIAVFLLIEPILATAWMHALANESGVLSALRRGARLYLAAWLSRFAVVFAVALPLALAFGIAYGAHLATRQAYDPRVHDVGVVIASVPFLLVVLVAVSLHDLAWAALVTDGPRSLEAVLVAFRALRPLEVLLRLAASTFALVLGALATACTIPRTTFATTIVLAFVAHALLFGRTLVRAVWLARCVETTAKAR